jgi:Domain of unknown function (DUF5666)
MTRPPRPLLPLLPAERPPGRTCQRLALALALLVAVGGCSVPRPTPQAQAAGNVCATQASLVNPNTGGLGGTGIQAGATRSTGGLGGTGLQARTSDDPGGIGGTGQHAGAPGGMGGTGAVAAAPRFGEGGIGGTGIVGVISGFASICVNGIEVHYDAATPVWDGGRPGSARMLAVGQVVAVTAQSGGEQTTARGIATIHSVVGPLDAVDAGTGKLQVMGQKVVALEPADLAGLRPGDWVRVGGYRRVSGDIAASRVEPWTAPGLARAEVRGPASVVQGQRLKVGNTPVDLGTLTLPAALMPGQEVWVSGIWRAGVLHASQLVAEPTRTGLGQVDRVVLEGYIQSVGPRSFSLGEQMLLLGEGARINGGTEAELAVDKRVQISGRVGADQRITVDSVLFRGGGGRDGGSGSASSGKASNASGKGSNSSGKGSSGSESEGSGRSGSGSSGSGSSGSSGSGSSGSGSSGSGSSGSGSSGSGSSGSGSSGSGSSGTGSSGSGSSGSGSSGSGSSGSGSGSGSGGRGSGSGNR